MDDGSSDESPSIVEEFAAKDARFRLIQQKNGGPGAARNRGLRAARGEYFTFVDADDVLHPELLERLLGLARTHQADLVVCDYSRFESDDEFRLSLQNSSLLAGGTHVQHKPLLPEMVNWKRYRVHPWGKLYKRTQHGSLHFPHLCGPEDAYASFDVYTRSNCTVFSQMRLYGYREVGEGLTRSVFKYRNYITGDAQVVMHCEGVLGKHDVSSTVTEQIAKPYIMRIFGFLNEMSVDNRLSTDEKNGLMALADQGLRDIKRCVAGKYRVIPPVHYVPYIAVRLRALWLLILWQWIRIHVVRRSIRLFRFCFGLRNRWVKF